jgi:hypothetical protein
MDYKGMKKHQSIGPLLGQIFRKIGPQIGATIVIEPKWRTVGQITFTNGEGVTFGDRRLT